MIPLLRLSSACRRCPPRCLWTWQSSRLQSSASSLESMSIDPGKLVTGLTHEMLETNPEMLEFMKANYPFAFPLDFPTSDTSDEVFPEQIVYERNIRPIKSYVRDSENLVGSRDSRRLRKQKDLIPGILYGNDESQGIFSNLPESKITLMTPNNELQREINRYHHSFQSRVYNLTLYEDEDDTVGTVHRVTPRDVQVHPVRSSIIYCANFCRYHAKRSLKLPIVGINEDESVILRRDGFIVPINRFIECYVEDGVPIPEKIEMECTGLKYREVIRLDRLIIPDGVRISKQVYKKGIDFVVGVVFGKSKAAIEEDESKKAEDEKEASAKGGAKKKK